MKNKTILLICHDAGAANALSRFALAWPRENCQLKTVALKYATPVLMQAGIQPDRIFHGDMAEHDIDILLDEFRPEAVLLGSSLDSWGERHACRAARHRGVFTVSLIDWWSNFGRRYSSPATMDLQYLPDAIAVPDGDAREGCIAEGIPESLLHITGNPYWDYLLKISVAERNEARFKIRTRMGMPKQAHLILLISSNIRNLNLNLGYNEGDFFRAITTFSRVAETADPIIWAVRPHPQESVNELQNLLKDSNIQNCRVMDDISAFEAVCASDSVIGMCSSMLFEAALLGKKVVSFQPNLERHRLQCLRIFRHIGIPVITAAADIDNAIAETVRNGRLRPDLRNSPAPLMDGQANEALRALVMKK